MAQVFSPKGSSAGGIESLHFVEGEDRTARVTAYLKDITADIRQTEKAFSVPSIRQLAMRFNYDEFVIIDALNDLMMEGYDYTADDPDAPVVFTRTSAANLIRRFRWWNWPSLYRYGMTSPA